MKLKQEPSLTETINMMECLNNKGYITYFEGRGDGQVRVIAEWFQLNKQEEK